MIDFKVLLEGTKIISEKDGIINVTDITSSVSLIRAGGKIILVDSGSWWYKEKLIDLLKEDLIEPKDVDMVLLTHLHPDHAGNIYLFENAKTVECKVVVGWKEKTALVYRELSDIPLPDGITLIDTPGHMMPHSAVLVEQEGKKIFFSGDAVKRNMINKDFLLEGQDIPKMIDSAIKICEVADVIIPGHGPVINKEEISVIKENLLRIK